MRKTNYTRFINLTVNLSTIEGYVYNDNNGNNSYDLGVDTPLSNITISPQDEFFIRGEIPSVQTDANGHYLIPNIYPSKYTIYALENGFEINNASVAVTPGHLWYNVSKPKLAGAQGKVFYDTNKDLSYDLGEEMNGVTVQIRYANDNKLVSTMITSGSGDYAFSSLIPGKYILNATVANTTTHYYDYIKQQPITLEANTTLTQNLSIDYATIAVNGVTKSNGKNVGTIPVDFSPDQSVANNTAQGNSATSNPDGSYTANLMPGSYNVTVTENGDHGSYSFTGTLFLRMGEKTKSFDISLTKLSVTIQGDTTYSGSAVKNVTIEFSQDFTVPSNTAQDQITRSDTTGFYTVDLMPGAYNVTVVQQVSEAGRNVTYTFFGQLPVTSDEIPTGKTYNIALVRQQ